MTFLSHLVTLSNSHVSSEVVECKILHVDWLSSMLFHLEIRPDVASDFIVHHQFSCWSKSETITICRLPLFIQLAILERSSFNNILAFRLHCVNMVFCSTQVQHDRSSNHSTPARVCSPSAGPPENSIFHMPSVIFNTQHLNFCSCKHSSCN